MRLWQSLKVQRSPAEILAIAEKALAAARQERATNKLAVAASNRAKTIEANIELVEAAVMPDDLSRQRALRTIFDLRCQLEMVKQDMASSAEPSS